MATAHLHALVNGFIARRPYDKIESIMDASNPCAAISDREV